MSTAAEESRIPPNDLLWRHGPKERKVKVHHWSAAAWPSREVFNWWTASRTLINDHVYDSFKNLLDNNYMLYLMHSPSISGCLRCQRVGVCLLSSLRNRITTRLSPAESEAIDDQSEPPKLNRDRDSKNLWSSNWFCTYFSANSFASNWHCSMYVDFCTPFLSLFYDRQ